MGSPIRNTTAAIGPPGGLHRLLDLPKKQINQSVFTRSIYDALVFKIAHLIPDLIQNPPFCSIIQICRLR